MVLGQPRSFMKKNMFLVEIEGVGHSAWKSCSELSVEIGKTEYWEGGRIIPHKLPGRITVADLTLERGATRDRDLYDWLRTAADAATGRGLPDGLFKRDGTLRVLGPHGATVRQYDLFNLWPTKWVGGEWDAEADEVLMESVTLTFDYPELVR